ncbi:MAG TPA: hypothetical protein VE978_05090 [Chitinophagales bacterium]|nr:hypothetical protein [Chitinophagales bacterium]
MNRSTHFFSSILLIIIIPLGPIILEAILKHGTITDQSLTLTAAIFSVSVGTASDRFLFMLFSVFVCVFFSVCYGYILGNPDSLSFVHLAALFLIAVISLLHLAERYVRHFKEGEIFIRPFK